MQAKRILITGASIAGPTLAYWLHRFGYDVTIVEREPALRLGGQNIDIKGAAKEVAEKMGIFEAIKAHHTGEQGTHYVDKDNHITASFEKGQPGGLTSELEILRGDLVELLYELTKDKVTYRFGDRVINLQEQPDHVRVHFESGGTENFDLVIGADGQRSELRGMAFDKDDTELKYLGLYTAYFTIPKAPTDSGWARWYIAPGSRNIFLRPDNKGTTRAALNFLSPDVESGKLPVAEQKALLSQTFADAGWESPRILSDLQNADELYLDAVTQVRMTRWSKGRIALTGDAAYCPTPLTGKGTALAMIGAYILAYELYTNGSYEQAFQAYEQKLRPYVEDVQKFPASFIKLFYPSSELGVHLLNQLESVIAGKTFQTIAGLFSSGKSDEDDFRLPVYED